MRVLLLYSNRTRILEPVPPIGLGYVATATQAAGHTVRFLDLMVSDSPEADLCTALADFRPDVVGISVRNIDNVVPQRVAWQLGEIHGIIASIRQATAAPIVLGGPAISILKSDALRRFDADFTVVGEGEDAFPDLLSAIARGSGFDAIPGLCYRDRGAIHFSEPVRRPHFQSSGMADWIDWPAYERGGAAWSIHTKRGCPLECIYCNYTSMEGHALRRRPAAEVVDEIEQVHARIGPRTFEFTDTTFNIPPIHAVEICEEILRRNLRLKFSAVGVNPLGMTEELAALMKRAGFISQVISPDTASETMLRNLRKGFSLDDVVRSADLARKSRIHTAWFFLLGGPGETQETVEETVSFVEQHLNWPRSLTIFMTGLRVLPGTHLASSSVANGYLPADRNLIDPAFYFSPQISERWVLDRVNRAIARCPAIVHGAEETGSSAERLFYKALHYFGVAPPYWRFLPLFLRTPPLPYLRTRHTAVPVSAAKLYGGAPAGPN
jgi:radical SAM superfamily enzyme YgiQ (UPF0313 family)